MGRCPSRMRKHAKSESTQPRSETCLVTLYLGEVVVILSTWLHELAFLMPSYAQLLEFLIIKQEITNCGEIWQLRLPWILRRGRAQERKWQSDCRGKLFWRKGFRSWKIPNQWRVRAVNCGDSTKKSGLFPGLFFTCSRVHLPIRRTELSYVLV